MNHIGCEVEQTIIKQFSPGFYQKALCIYKEYVIFLVEYRGMYLYDKKKDICRCILKMFSTIAGPNVKCLESFDDTTVFINHECIILKRYQSLDIFSYNFKDFPKTWILDKTFHTTIEARSNIAYTERYVAFQDLTDIFENGSSNFLFYDLKLRKLILQYKSDCKENQTGHFSKLVDIKMTRQRIMICDGRFTNAIKLYKYKEENFRGSIQLEQQIPLTSLSLRVGSIGLSDTHFFMKSHKFLHLVSFQEPTKEKKIILRSPRYDRYVFTKNHLMLYQSNLNRYDTYTTNQLINLQTFGVICQQLELGENFRSAFVLDENMFYFNTRTQLGQISFVYKPVIDLYFYLQILNNTLLGAGNENEDVKRIIINCLKYNKKENVIRKQNGVRIFVDPNQQPDFFSMK